jgi:peptidoglycan/LPS O-acetylase OafA/YrhL
MIIFSWLIAIQPNFLIKKYSWSKFLFLYTWRQNVPWRQNVLGAKMYLGAKTAAPNWPVPYFFLELQFYLFVPLLILIIGFLTKRHYSLGFVFIIALGTVSFLSQIYSTSNSKRMTLDGRIWQFLAGFLAHFAYNSKLLDWNISKEDEKNRLMRILFEFRNAMPILLLLLILTFDFLDVIKLQTSLIYYLRSNRFVE